MAEQTFKTTLMGGFDKDDVLAQVKEMKDAAFAEKSKLEKALADKDKQIAELNRALDQKDEDHKLDLQQKDAEKDRAVEAVKRECAKQIAEVQKKLAIKSQQKEQLEYEITEKYQKYIDRYDLIGDLVFEAQQRAEQIIVDAEQKRDMLMLQAREEAQKCLDSVQAEVDEKLADGKRKYIAVQEEMNEIVELINQAQRRFMSSYKEVHRIVSTMPESMRELEDEEGPVDIASAEELESVVDLKKKQEEAAPADMDSAEKKTAADSTEA